MRYLLIAITASALFSCQKKVDVTSTSINGEVVESNNGVYVEPCHSTSFLTNYPAQPIGKTPPFKFTKTLYPSGRVKTINMLSRANPNHSAFKQQAWEVIGTFTYDGTSKAFLKGTKQLWEYYKTSSGAAAKRSIMKKNIALTYEFHGAGTEEEPGVFVGQLRRVYNEIERKDALYIWAFGGFEVFSGSDEPEGFYDTYGSYDDAGNPDGRFTIECMTSRGKGNAKKIVFNSIIGKEGWKAAYQPTQNWISMEYNIAEAMQWIQGGFAYPFGKRVNVSVEFYPYSNATKVVQSQLYKNHKYDTKNNLLSYTYGDNVVQKTTWVCK